METNYFRGVSFDSTLNGYFFLLLLLFLLLYSLYSGHEDVLDTVPADISRGLLSGQHI